MSTRASRVVGVALAGGQSRRMGHDKAALRLEGSSLLERAVARLRQATAEVLVADRGLGLMAGVRSVPDGPGAGPAAGILGAAVERPGQSLLVLACDLPAVPAALLRHLAAATEEDIHIPRWRRGPEPLCALYRPAALAVVAAEARAGRLALHAILRQERLTIRYLEGERLDAFGDPRRVFLNLNTPADLAELEDRGSDRPGFA